MSTYTFSPSVLTLPVDSRLINILRAYKLTCLRDVEQLNEEELSEEVHISREEAASILSAVRQITQAESIKQRIKVKSLFEIFAARERVPHQLRQESNEWTRIPTKCSHLDAWLGGGIPLASLTEFYGQAGIGKTQFCFQLCVNVQKPRTLGGLQGEALFIDGEGSFRTSRLNQIARAAVTSWDDESRQRNIQNSSVIDDASVASLTLESILERIHYAKILNARQMILAILNPVHLEKFVSDHPNIRLIVLDGLSYQFRFDSSQCFHDDWQERDNVIHQITHKLRFWAHSRNISFVISNQVTYDIEKQFEKPALGAIWSRACATKLHLEVGGANERFITLAKSQFKPRARFRYRITESGVTDAE